MQETFDDLVRRLKSAVMTLISNFAPPASNNFSELEEFTAYLENEVLIRISEVSLILTPSETPTETVNEQPAPESHVIS